MILVLITMVFNARYKVFFLNLFPNFIQCDIWSLLVIVVYTMPILIALYDYLIYFVLTIVHICSYLSYSIKNIPIQIYIYPILRHSMPP